MSDFAARVHYFDKQFLRVDEFRDEQLYQLALRRRHNNTQHTWGIVSGLEIGEDERSIVVEPGLAIDGYGRELLLATKFTVAPETFDDLDSDRLDLWLVYDRQDDGSIPEGYGECGASAAGKAYRSTEHPDVRVERPLSNTVDARRPPGVSSEVLDAPLPPISDERTDLWRVYLGRVIRQRDGKFSIDGTRRPYAGVVAEAIDHPANASRVEIGRDSRAAHSRTIGETTVEYQETTKPPVRRFAVFVPEPGGQQQQSSSSIELAPRIEVFENGQIGFNGQTTVHGNLCVSGGAVQFTDAATFEGDDAPKVASIYRYLDDTSDELRIDLGSDEGAGKRKLVIGFSGADGKFTPCLSVELQEKNGQLEPVVTIFGDLDVSGTIAGRILPVMIGPEAMAAARAAYQQGLAQGQSGP
jgi:hypothetical protein